ncbi:hypothetical protein [Couchioplanes caeruleus]|uniref:hypothetical protein n=1 Tax=Couchioplanes caeruleus TaxID=56438 RepID=UPI00116037BD|nr:hypothetical protein [Couchioplanes caeruleus]
MSQPLLPAAAYREHAMACLRTGDGVGAHRWAKGWIGAGGGPHLDPWLVYVADALLRGQPRNAVHAVDLAIGGWLPGPQDRATMLYIRGVIVFRRLDDPRTALRDFQPARPALPDWLAPLAEPEIHACESAAPLSRKRKPSVSTARAYLPPPHPLSTHNNAYEPRSDGEPPDNGLRTLLNGMGIRLC